MIQGATNDAVCSIRKTRRTTSRSFMVFALTLLSGVRAWTTRPPLAVRRTCLSSTTSSAIADDEEALRIQRVQRKNRLKEKRRAGKERRKEFVGMAKAVDRGQSHVVTYKPGGDDGQSFSAVSGLPRTAPFTVLGIESSCDDTGAAVVRSDGVLLGESLVSQAEIHEEWGGIVPGLAQTAHEENLDAVIQQALDNAKMTMDEIDAVGVTVGPGLEICLRVGCARAKELAIQYNKPFVGVHHLEAHILMARLDPNIGTKLKFPFLALLVSGGHCQLLQCIGIGQYRIIGGTIDDSLGEAYDKTARLLGLPTGGGGGPAVEKLARDGDPKAIPLTIPLQKRREDCDFSYAGLKTNVRRAAEKLVEERGVDSVNDLPYSDKADIAASFQHIAIVHIEQRLERAMPRMPSNISSLALVGGVAANQELRRRIEAVCAARNWDLVVPPPRLCTDQGAMSAWAAVERLRVGSSDEPRGHDVYARYPFFFYPDKDEEEKVDA